MYCNKESNLLLKNVRSRLTSTPNNIYLTKKGKCAIWRSIFYKEKTIAHLSSVDT